ncbi:hypothetical protein Y032_0015g2522 [Ancylostoma ceylanicum]|uniref:Uncharacterized protein n=1 Tax=Ancylostoma ceylanicum TaxID=53326 RepID=A0A016V6C0_9BILA|nr:hypothetical protein Y032_0015g2522 [Ancylostoma ceylanicum]
MKTYAFNNICLQYFSVLPFGTTCLKNFIVSRREKAKKVYLGNPNKSAITISVTLERPHKTHEPTEPFQKVKIP